MRKVVVCASLFLTVCITTKAMDPALGFQATTHRTNHMTLHVGTSVCSLELMALLEKYSMSCVDSCKSLQVDNPHRLEQFIKIVGTTVSLAEQQRLQLLLCEVRCTRCKEALAGLKSIPLDL